MSQTQTPASAAGAPTGAAATYEVAYLDEFDNLWQHTVQAATPEAAWEQTKRDCPEALTLSGAVAQSSPELEKLRRSWIQWLGYKFRHGDDYHEFVDLLAPEYNEWAKGVLGREKHCLGMEPTKDYFSAAIAAANKEQLLDLRQVRYIYEHPVADGWTQAFRATLCAPPKAIALLRHA